jgi:biopolymer transport protein ExbB/TolQ
MIKAFSALSAAGTQIKLLANGISEALITATGILHLHLQS